MNVMSRPTTKQVSHGEGVIILDRLTKWYRKSPFSKRHVVVRNVAIGVSAGECFCLVGVNGSGKTTIFDMLMGKRLVSSGTALIDGCRVTSDTMQVGLRSRSIMRLMMNSTYISLRRFLITCKPKYIYIYS